MKTAIYVGPHKIRKYATLQYGMTGTAYRWFDQWTFVPDGKALDINVRRSDIYFQTNKNDLRSKSCRNTVAT